MGFVSRPRLGKYNNRLNAAYGGHCYHSMLEARYAMQLDLRVRAGELKEWRRQEHIHLKVNGTKTSTYIIDFVEVYPDGHLKYIEVKGREDPVWRLKWKHFRAQYPNWDVEIVKVVR